MSTQGPRRGHHAADGRPLQEHIDALHAAADDLVADEDLSVVLRRITERAAAALAAAGHLLAVHAPDGSPLIHGVGHPSPRCRELGLRLLAGDELPDAIVVDVSSARRRHGHLALFPAPGEQVVTELVRVRRTLSTYARHAAAALDLATALEVSRRNEVRSQALLTLSHDLAAATTTEQVARHVADALSGIVGCNRSAVHLWNAQAGELIAAAVAGADLERRAAAMQIPVRPQEFPELVDVLTHQQPIVIRMDTATDALRARMVEVDLGGLLAVPMIGGGELLGIATASWTVEAMPDEPIETLVDRMCAVGESAALALQNTTLLSAVRHQTLHDALTGLPNRVLFAERLAEALRTDQGAAVLYCDLDRFKRVNDQHGHATGDELLRQVSRRLLTAVRSEDVVARLSGDEFAILVAPLVDESVPAGLGQRLVACFEAPFRIDGRELRVTASVGIASRAGNARGDDLVRAADSAMYAAKQRGRNQIAFAATRRIAHESQPAELSELSGLSGLFEVAADAPCPSLEAELNSAIAAGQLRLLYQPIVDITQSLDAPVVVGAEALLRWQHPRLGLLLPAAFLPSAEETGLIVDLDLWAVTEACQAAMTWAGTPAVAVNLSSASLADPRLPACIRGALADSGLAPERLHIEVVESRSLLDVPGLVDRLRALRRLGIRVALDDFGTGFSTLTWLQQLPVDRIKIDRSFTCSVATDPASRAVIRGVLALGAELGLGVVAEGVEAIEQATALRTAGCTLVQGYLVGRPAPTDPGDTARTAAVLRRTALAPAPRRADREGVTSDQRQGNAEATSSRSASSSPSK